MLYQLHDSTSSDGLRAGHCLRLAPQTHSNKAAVAHQIENIRVSVAPFISRTFVVRANGINVEGDPVRDQSSLSSTVNSVNVYLTEETAGAQNLPHALSISLADHLEIEEVSHRSLLHTALNDSDLESIYATFVELGIEVQGVVFGEYLSRHNCLYSFGD